MKRSYALDVLICPHCAGPMDLLSLIEDEATAKQILDHLGMPSRAPPRGRRRRAERDAEPVAPVEDLFDGCDSPSRFE